MGARRVRLWLSAGAVAGYLPALGAPLRHWLDFAAFYAGGQLVFTSRLLDPVAVALLQVGQAMPPTPFVSPPFVALAYAPLTALPYGLAALVQLGVMLAALLGGAGLWADALGLPRRWAVLGALAWGAASASVVSGQVDTLAVLLSGLAVRLIAERRRAWAGAVAGLLAFKPQLTIGAGLALLRPLGRTGLVVLLVVGAILYGLAGIAVGGDALWPVRWASTLTSYSAADFAANGWQASGPVSLGIRLGLLTGSWLPVAVGIGLALAVLWLSLRAWRPASLAVDVALWSALGLVASPHVWVYDATLLLPAVGAWAVSASRLGWPSPDVALLVAAFALAALWPLGGFIGVTAVPVVVCLVPLRLAQLARHADRIESGPGLLGHVSAIEAAGMFRHDSPT